MTATVTSAAATADAPEPAAGAFVLDTDLLGPLVVPDGAARAAELEALSRRVTLYASRARGDGTRRTYRSAWRHYTTWCHALGREPLAADPDTIAMYVVHRADNGCAVSTVRVGVHPAALRFYTVAYCTPS